MAGIEPASECARRAPLQGLSVRGNCRVQVAALKESAPYSDKESHTYTGYYVQQAPVCYRNPGRSERCSQVSGSSTTYAARANCSFSDSSSSSRLAVINFVSSEHLHAHLQCRSSHIRRNRDIPDLTLHISTVSEYKISGKSSSVK